MDTRAEEICEEECPVSEEELASIRSRLMDDDAAESLAEWFKALGDPTRVKLLGALQGRELCVHDLSSLLAMGQSAVSHQLRYLRNLRMVKRRKSGKTVFYSLDDVHVEQLFDQTLRHLKHE